MKFLCVCQHGHSRSVCCCRVLHELGHQAVACGWATAPDALPVLADWADRVIIMERQFQTKLPLKYMLKTVVCEVGPDVWSNPYNQELHRLIARLLKEQGIGNA